MLYRQEINFRKFLAISQKLGPAQIIGHCATREILGN